MRQCDETSALGKSTCGERFDALPCLTPSLASCTSRSPFRPGRRTALRPCEPAGRGKGQRQVANTKSAIKRARQTAERTARNKSIKSAVRTFVRKARVAVATPDAAAPEQTVREAVSQLNRAASKGSIHKRNASRRIGRLM